MWPTTARKQVLRHHARLKSHLLAVAAELAKAGPKRVPEDVHARLAAASAVLRHTHEVEDQILPPLLHEADSWGDVRTDAMTAHHEHQRSTFAALEVAVRGGGSADDIFDATHGLVSELLRDLATEEAVVLSPDVLRDDVVAIDAAAG